MQPNSYIWAKDEGISLKEHIKHLLKVFDNIKVKIPEELREPVKYAILLHDLGKVLPYFQIISVKNKEYKPFNIDRDMNIYHSLASVLFTNKDELRSILKDEGIVELVLCAVAYHHWKKSLEEDLIYGQEKCKRLLNYDNNDYLVKNLQEELRELLEELNVNVGLINFDQDMAQGLANGLGFSDYVIPPYKLDWLPKRLDIKEEEKKKWVLISGFLQRCDHYASFLEKDKETPEEKNFENVEILNIDYTSILDNTKKELSVKSGKNIEDIELWQEKMVKNCVDKSCILIAPTGSGKTEFAFLWSNGNKLVYTLPIRAAVEQIYSRAKKIFDIDGKKRTGILHGDADVYIVRELRKEENNTEQQIEDAEEQNESINIYQVSKNLSYPVIIATGDQFFPYALRPPLYERIYATLSYSRLVIDEVQAYDPVACAIVVKFIEDMERLGGKFLLMTATLPDYVETEISKRIGEESFRKINLYEEHKEKYESLKKHKLKVRVINKSNDKNKIRDKFTIPEEYIDEIINKAVEDKQRVLVILNTVRQAESVFRKIKDKIKQKGGIDEKNLVLFHSRFTFNQKQEKKTEVEKLFRNPKDDLDKEGKILVTTQVVEASIDIDADVLYTEICPLDALVQRMGRVLRRYKENYSHNGGANINVIVFKEGYESGDGRVYDRELIEKALVILAYYNDYVANRGESKENGGFLLEIYNKYLSENQGGQKSKKKMKGKKQEENSEKNNVWENIKSESVWQKVLEKLKITEILLSEQDKYNLLKEFYASLDPDGKYLSDFHKTLSILDAGYMSDKKSEAQEIFRRIIDVSVVYDDVKEEFKKGLKDFVNGDKFSYTDFKDKIVAEFVVGIPYYYLRDGSLKSLSEWVREIEKELENTSDDLIKKRLEKVKKWCSGIFIARLNEKNKIDLENIM